MYKRVFKRFIDFLVAVVICPFVIIIILVLAPILYASSPGPLFFNGERVGYKGKKFKMFKLRTMHVNAPDIRNADGSTYNSENDIRVTKIGSILRKTSIDELPQIFNVLIGDMSFVGPRPGLQKGEELSPDEQKRRSVRPGITGYSQAFYRNSDSMEQRMINDIKYAESVTIKDDIRIILKTIETVIKKRNINRNS